MIAVFTFAAGAQDGQSRVKYVATEATGSSFVHLIPVAGMAAMSIDVKDSETEFSHDTGTSAGLLMNFGSGFVTLETGVLYNQFGAKIKQDEVTIKLKFDYISIPVALKLNLFGDVENTVFLKAGVMPGFAQAKKFKAEFRGREIEQDVRGIKDFDLPAIAGMGGAISVAQNASLIIEASYIHSLQSIAKDDTNSDVRNTGFNVLGGVSIGL